MHDETDSRAQDCVIIFPPQWSPFQPPLSLPSLTGWLRRAGFAVRGIDANISFYHWLFTEKAIELLKEHLRSSPIPDNERLGCEAIFASAADFKADVTRVQTLTRTPSGAEKDAVKAHFLFINSFDLFLGAVSKALGSITISPVGLELAGGVYSETALQHFANNPPAILEVFAQDFLSQQVLPHSPNLIGLSCIGQEQLPFTLLLGRILKAQSSASIVVGGTILSRIYERGVLPLHWFGRYFDIVVRNEGEKPAEALLWNLRRYGCAADKNVPGIVYLDRGLGVIATEPSIPLKPEELPVPYFGDLPLESYLSSEVTLPVLASRGCYWGKCEFCHHGMVYGEKYTAYETEAVLRTISSHSKLYGVRQYSFNDEAIPPKIVRRMGEIFPAKADSQWAFTGLVKFEKFYSKSDWENLWRIGFRSLYVGLESASERVLKLMHKPNSKMTIQRNLAEAADAGIWMHCFLFFGFPGEAEEDARETFEFILQNSAIIGSFGCGQFSLEHNAPIFRHLADFPIIVNRSTSDLDVYYSYRVSEGVSAKRASEWTERLNAEALQIPKYAASTWIPREHLLTLLAQMSVQKLTDIGTVLVSESGIPPGSSVREIFSLAYPDAPDSVTIAINRANRRVFKVSGVSADVFRLIHERDVALSVVRDEGRLFYERIVGTPKDRVG